MKTLKWLALTVAFVVGLALTAVPARAQTVTTNANGLPNGAGLAISTTNVEAVLGNLPQSSSFTNAQFEIFVGAVMQGDTSFNNSIELRYDITPTFFVSGQIQNSPAASVINAASLYVGLRKAWDTVEVWGKLGGGRDWSLATWKGEAWFGIAYAPFQSSTSSVLQNVSTFCEEGLIVSQSNKQPSNSTIGGVTYHF
jgi:hypothetical protein